MQGCMIEKICKKFVKTVSSFNIKKPFKIKAKSPTIQTFASKPPASISHEKSQGEAEQIFQVQCLFASKFTEMTLVKLASN